MNRERLPTLFLEPPTCQRHRKQLDQGNGWDDHGPNSEWKPAADTVCDKFESDNGERDREHGQAKDSAAPSGVHEQTAAFSRQLGERCNYPKT